jgi:hypothetical protein
LRSFSQDELATAERFQSAIAPHFLHDRHDFAPRIVIQDAQCARHLLVVQGLVGLTFEDLKDLFA